MGGYVSSSVSAKISLLNHAHTARVVVAARGPLLWPRRAGLRARASPRAAGWPAHREPGASSSSLGARACGAQRSRMHGQNGHKHTTHAQTHTHELITFSPHHHHPLSGRPSVVLLASPLTILGVRVLQTRARGVVPPEGSYVQPGNQRHARGPGRRRRVCPTAPTLSTPSSPVLGVWAAAGTAARGDGWWCLRCVAHTLALGRAGDPGGSWVVRVGSGILPRGGEFSGCRRRRPPPFRTAARVVLDVR